MADAGPAGAAHQRARLAAGQPAHLVEDRDGPDGRVVAVEAGHDQHPRLAPDTARRRADRAGGVDGGLGLGVELHRHDHARQQHAVGQRKHREGEIRHVSSSY